MKDLEISGKSFRSQRNNTGRQKQLFSEELNASSTIAGKTSILQKWLESRISGGLPAFIAAIKYMAEDHNLTIGPDEIKDILIALGCKISQADSKAIYNILRKGHSSVVPKTAADLLKVSFSDEFSQDKHGDPMGGYNIDNIRKLSGIHAERHLQKAVFRSETRQSKHMLTLPTKKIFELLKNKMMEHLPSGAGIIDAIRLFHHGHGTHISFQDFKNAMKDTFNLLIPEKRLRKLFSNFDHNGGGDISIEEFISHVWEPEKNNKSPVMLRDNQQKLRMKNTLAKAQQTYEKSSLGHLNADEAAKVISDKLHQHLRDGSDSILQAFREFHHGHGMEINKDEFIATMKDLGIKLYPPSEYDELFHHFDKTNTGTISFQEFSKEVLKVSSENSIMDSNNISGADIRRQKMLQKSKEEKGLIGKNVNLAPLLRERLLNHVDSGPNEITRAFQKFKQLGEGLSNDGLTLSDFISAIKRLGLRVDKEQSSSLFLQIAGSRGSVIDLPALRKNLFFSKSKGGTQEIGQHNHKSPPRKLKPLSKKLTRLSDNTNMRELIRSKLTERMSGGANELLKAFRSFHTGHGLEISPSEFNGVVQHLLETKLPVSELQILFHRIDTDGNGVIDYSEFVDEIMTSGKKPILYGELRRQAAQNKAKEHRKKYGMLNPNTARRQKQILSPVERAGIPRVSPIKTHKNKIHSKYEMSKKGEKRWNQMNRAFTHEDVQRSGTISHSKFVHILSTFQLKIASDELLRLGERYGRGNGIFYPKFMKDMGKMMSAEYKRKEQNESSINLHQNTSERNKPNEENTNEEVATKLLLNLIAKQWKQLQFSFSQKDVKGTGYLDMKTIMNVMAKADPRVPGLIPYIVPKLRLSYSSKDGLINYKKMIRDNLKLGRPSTSSTTNGLSTIGESTQTLRLARTTTLGTGRNSKSKHRPLTWRIKDSLFRTNKANAIISRIRLQIGSASERKAVLTQFEIRDSTHSSYIEKSMLRSIFARLGIKVSAADVKGLGFCFEVPNQKHLFNYRDFLRVVERGF